MTNDIDRKPIKNCKEEFYSPSVNNFDDKIRIVDIDRHSTAKKGLC